METATLDPVKSVVSQNTRAHDFRYALFPYP